MASTIDKGTRKTHRVLAIAFALPLALVFLTGILLQLKKDFAWIQPQTRRGADTGFSLPPAAILAAAKTVPEANISDWPDIDRLDVRPDRGLIKIQTKNHFEIQICAHAGTVLQAAWRRSDWIEQLHDGSFFSETVKRFVFLPGSIAAFVLLLSGLWLAWLPLRTRRRRNRRRADAERPA